MSWSSFMGSNSYHNLRIFSFRFIANLPKALRWRPPLLKEKAPILELQTNDILRSLNFWLKCNIVSGAFPCSSHLIGVEIVILHFSNSFRIYVFSLRIFSEISLDVLSKHPLLQCAKWCNPVISEVVASYNHTCRLYEHLESILL